MNLKPLHDRVIVRPQPEERVSAGGIVLPDGAADRPVRGTVLAVGDGTPLPDGSARPVAVIAGDVVLYGKFSGTEVKIDGDVLLVMREADIVAVIQ